MIKSVQKRTIASTILYTLMLFCITAPAWCHDGTVVADCDAVGSGGDSISRGLQFRVGADFASVEVRMSPSTSGVYEFTAELRRSVGFDGPILAAVRVTENLTAMGSQTPWQVVHIDFPLIAVSGSETFTLRFIDKIGSGALYFETPGIGSFPCQDIVVTENNTAADPTLRTSAAGMRILAPPEAKCPDGGCQGDINGDGIIDLKDAAIVAANWLRMCAPAQLPVLVLKGNAIDLKIAQSLAQTFKINPDVLIGEDGAMRYTDPEIFQHIPTVFLGEDVSEEDKLPIKIEAIDFDAITGEVLDGKTAMGIVSEALMASGFQFPAALQIARSVDHSMFQAVKTDGSPIVEAPLDTHINHTFMLGEIPVTGPGAKMKFVLNSQQQLTHLTMALPGVQGGGQVYPLISQQQADNLARQAYGFSPNLPNENIQLNSQVVYWIPAGAEQLTQLVPQFLYGGTMKSPHTGQDIQLRRILIPAIARENAPQLVPEVQLFVDPMRNTMYAGTEVGGGTPPYTYSWTSSTTDLSGNTGPSIQYAVMPRQGFPSPTEETLTIVVTDAAGLSTSASETIPLITSAPPEQEQAIAIVPKVGGIADVGTEWVGTSQGLGGSAGNAQGFADRFNAAGITVRFNWGDFNAWERDFKDPSIAGGDDTNWIDNVDAAFYTGHANSDGFTFPGTIEDGFLHYDEARWGNHDLEWLVIAACGPLQLDAGGKTWWQRWGPAFNGLHMICAYQTVSNDNTVEGTKYANYLISGETVRQAWINTAIEVQPSSVRFSVMGVIGKDGMSNMNDHFWGKGSVGPDIRGSNIIGYWLIHGPS